MQKNKKRTIRIISIFIIIIVLLFSLKCCKKDEENTTEDDYLKYVEFIESQLKTSDKTMTELEKWLTGIDVEFICTPDVGEGFRHYGNRITEDTKMFKSKTYTGDQKVSQLTEIIKYFDSIEIMGNKMIVIADSIEKNELNEVLRLFDELIVIHQQVKEARGAVNE